MRLPYQGVKEFACFDGFMGNDRNASRFGFIHRTLKMLVIGVVDIWEFKRPVCIGLHRFHEGVSDGNRNVKIGDGFFVGLTMDKIVNIRVVHP